MSPSIIRRLPVALIRLIGGAVIRLIYRIRVAHPERIPAKGGALLLPNHVTFVDGFIISAICPRPVRFVMDEAFSANPAVRVFTSIFNTVTIRRDQPREAIRITIEALRNGDLVCLFPEGQLTRTGTLNELRRGFELIAKKADHPLIPMWVDGSWGSIFSFERGSFFRKIPYHLPYGMTVAFGKEMLPENADLETVRQAMHVCSASAMAKRFGTPAWGKRAPLVKFPALKKLRPAGEYARRRMWINGHQIGQIGGLQRGEPFFFLGDDPVLSEIPALLLAFPELFDAEARCRDFVDGNQHAAWVGGTRLRAMLGTTQLAKPIEFYDFGADALEPVYRAELLHLPCLAIDGMVISMSMPDPAKPGAHSEAQIGRKPGTWGKLLTGWFLQTAEDGRLHAHGPAAPPEGLALPGGAYLDAEGFLTAFKPAPRR